MTTRYTDRLLTLAEAAEKLGVCRRTVERHIARRAIGSVRIGSSVRVAESECDRFILARTRPARDAARLHASPDWRAR